MIDDAEERFTPEEIEAGRRLFAGEAEFLRGVTKPDALPDAFPLEVAFAGRSNVGKSSLLNALLGRRQLARTSNTPGRTRELNFFRVGDKVAIVDMPGYGYAQAPKTSVRTWQSLIGAYLRGRPTLRRAFVLVDSRHGPAKADIVTFDMLDEAAVSYQLVLTKTDKLKPSEVDAAMQKAAAAIARRPAAHPELHVTSSATGVGLPELRAEIVRLLAR
ncbi:MAG: ribosome biogenesis GTP-binding protein YihA/YsxC [Parvibaculaceae bacterium]